MPIFNVLQVTRRVAARTAVRATSTYSTRNSGSSSSTRRPPTHDTLNRSAREIGNRAAIDLGRRETLVELDNLPPMRTNVLRRSADRALKRGEASPIGRGWNDAWRKAMPAQDELVSTSTMREFLTGIFEARSLAGLTRAELDVIDTVADGISALRLPTRFSGYSLDGEVMQHPTSGTGVFGDPSKTGAKHDERDRQRKEYVINAMQDALDKTGNLSDVARAGSKAAIEFTLNYFTAPLSAGNVLRNSLRAGTPIDGAEVQEQVTARERMKDLYVELGGALRPGIASESPSQALMREWPGPPPDNVFEVMPPSPRRLLQPAPTDPPLFEL